MTAVTGGPVYDSYADIDCDGGTDNDAWRVNATNVNNGDIVLYCDFLVAGISVYGQLIP